MELVFKKTSWHYLLQKFVFGYVGNEESNLCPYFWRTVFAAAFFPIALVGYLARRCGQFGRSSSNNFEVGVEFLILTMPCIVLTSIITWILYSLINGIIIYGLIVPALIVFSMVSCGVPILTLDLWIPYLMAIKSKVCPVIKWE